MSKTVTCLLATGLTGLALGATACSSADSEDTTATSTTTAAATETSTTEANTGCPVTQEELYEALVATTEIYSELSADVTGVTDVSCYLGYATAQTVVKQGTGESTSIIFGYDPREQVWSALDINTDGHCSGTATQEILEHLEGCAVQ